MDTNTNTNPSSSQINTDFNTESQKTIGNQYTVSVPFLNIDNNLTVADLNEYQLSDPKSKTNPDPLRAPKIYQANSDKIFDNQNLPAQKNQSANSGINNLGEENGGKANISGQNTIYENPTFYNQLNQIMQSHSDTFNPEACRKNINNAITISNPGTNNPTISDQSTPASQKLFTCLKPDFMSYSMGKLNKTGVGELNPINKSGLESAKEEER